ncbi:MAG: hypothetical protein H6Q70_495 [Firmicutes bacterium]|nr:hypothetical protein [Bacillota bacterium]
MLLYTAQEACKLLREHDTLITKKHTGDVYRSLSEQQAKNIARLIEQMDLRLRALQGED